jgi:hypothetical protein
MMAEPTVYLWVESLVACLDRATAGKTACHLVALKAVLLVAQMVCWWVEKMVEDWVVISVHSIAMKAGYWVDLIASLRVASRAAWKAVSKAV